MRAGRDALTNVPEPPRAGTAVLLALLCVLITYGSIYPFDYVAHRPTLADVAHLLHDWPRRLSASDVVGNVLLFVPLGLLIPSLSERLSARVLYATAAVCYALLLQYLQFWYPSRVPSGSDAAFNTLGVLLGLAFGLIARGRLGRATRSLARGTMLWPIAAALLLCWISYRWFPWAPTLDVGDLKNALKPLVRNMAFDATRVLHDASAWLLWFWLAAQGPLRPRTVVLLGIGITLAEPLFVGNTVTPDNLAGMVAAIFLRPLLACSAHGRELLFVLLGASALASGLAPFRFTALNGFHWLPFAGMLSGSMVVNTASLIEKCYLYGGLVVLLAAAGAHWWGAGLAVAAGLACIEWLQMSIPGRTAEITDPLLALLLAVAFRSALMSRTAARGTGQPPSFMHENGLGRPSSNQTQLYKS